MSPDKEILTPLLANSAARHEHLCPRQVLGVRLGLRGLLDLGFIDSDYRPHFQNTGKRLLTIVETDGCGADGIAVATDCATGHRTLRILDFGKVAATLVDTHTQKAVRVRPQPDARQEAICLADKSENHWEAYLSNYQRLPDEVLMHIQAVKLTQSIGEILSHPDARAVCEECGEEIFNEREVVKEGFVLCRGCAGEKYYVTKN